MYYLNPYLSRHLFKEFSTQLQNMSSMYSPQCWGIIIQWGKYENFSDIIIFTPIDLFHTYAQVRQSCCTQQNYYQI